MKPRRLFGVALIFGALLLSPEARGDVSFILDIGAGYARYEQEDLRVPVFLSNSDSVGGWETLMEYDDSRATVTGVELCDSMFVPDSVFIDDSLHVAPGTYYAPWYGHPELRPEYFNYQLSVFGHSDWVKTVGIMDMTFPTPIVPPILPGDDQLFFCYILDVSSEWDFQPIAFHFHTRDCDDNILTDDGVIWGPETLSAPPSTCPDRPDSLRVVRLLDGAVTVYPPVPGDINCDGVVFSIADAMIFLYYLVYGEEMLYGCPSFEAHSQASDVNLNTVPWEMADVVTHLRVLNGYQVPPHTPPDTTDLDTVWVTVQESHQHMVIGATSDVALGGAAFVFSYDPELTIDLDFIVLSERLQQVEALFDDIADTASGELRIAFCSLFSDSIAAGSGPLLTIPLIGYGHPTLESADLCDPRGGLLQILISPVGIVITEPSRRTVDRFTLSKNYPNPFNPTTEITYNLPVDCHVRLEIYNISGQRVAILADEKQTAGHKSVHWDSRNQTGNEVSSGLYFYRLQAGDFVETRKMILLR